MVDHLKKLLIDRTIYIDGTIDTKCHKKMVCWKLVTRTGSAMAVCIVNGI